MGYMIGVDGGATGTVAIVTDEDGTILSSATGPASNYYAVGHNDARDALRQVVTEVVQRAGRQLEDCQAAVFGLAGLNHPDDEEVFREMITPIGLGGKLVIENDIVIAWAGATNCEPGVVMICGTGASAFGINQAGERHKALGWDFILGDQGSGYWIGLEGIRAAIKAWDGRLENTLLLDALTDHYQLKDPQDMLHVVHAEEFEKPDYARFAKRVSACAAQGDLIAKDILNRAGEELGQAACGIIKSLKMSNDTFKVGLIGGTWRAGPDLNDVFANRVYALAPNAIIEASQHPAVIGAVIYALYQNGTLTPEVIAQIDSTSAQTLRWKT